MNVLIIGGVAAGTLPADLVVLSVGVRPNTAWLADTGMEMFKGTILVDDRLRTSLPDVYAAGDCVMVKNRITGERQWSAMGSSANYEGRTLGRVLAGEAGRYPGVLGTGVVKLPGGLTEARARQAGGLRRGDRPGCHRRQGPLLSRLRLVRHQTGGGQGQPQAAGRPGAGPLRGGQDDRRGGDRHRPRRPAGRSGRAGPGLRAALLHRHPSLCAGGVCAGQQAQRRHVQHDPPPSTRPARPGAGRWWTPTASPPSRAPAGWT